MRVCPKEGDAIGANWATNVSYVGNSKFSNEDIDANWTCTLSDESPVEEPKKKSAAPPKKKSSAPSTTTKRALADAAPAPSPDKRARVALNEQDLSHQSIFTKMQDYEEVDEIAKLAKEAISRVQAIEDPAGKITARCSLHDYTPRHICSRHTCTTTFHDTHARLHRTTCMHDYIARHACTTTSHDMYARLHRTTCMHDNIARHVCTTTSHDMHARQHCTAHVADGWTVKLPIWAGMGRSRGLSSWGEKLPKKQSSRARRWEVKNICRQTIQDAMDFYIQTIGCPPVVTGMVPTTTRSKKSAKRARYGAGFHKHTPQLVEAPAEETIDMLSVFMFTVHIYYCLHLTPPVDQGTDAEVAVLKTIMGENCKSQLLRCMKTKFQVWMAFTTHSHDMYPRHIHTTCTHDTYPRHIPTTEMDQQKYYCG